MVLHPIRYVQSLGTLALTVCLSGTLLATEPARMLYVATDGNDAWTGSLPAPNAAKTDGPVATLAKARDLIRQWKAAQAGLRQAVTVQVRGGTYYIPQTITLLPEDSGTAQCPIRYEAYPGETPILCGGRPITGWKSDDGKVFWADVPEAKAGTWYFRQLFIDGRRQTRARFPNRDPQDPWHKGFLYSDWYGFGQSVGCIHNRGDWLEYKIRVPAEGTYSLWVYYAALNAPFGTKDMAGRTTIAVDGGSPVELAHLPDTAGWDKLQWSRCARLSLKAGSHVLRWQNVKGGGLTLDAFVLCDDPQWVPKQIPIEPASSGTHRLVIQAEQFAASHAPQLSISAVGSGSRTSIGCTPGTAKPSWAKAPDAEVHIFPTDCCRAFKQIVGIKSVEPDGSGIEITGKECIAQISHGDRFFVENVREELDAPGEWYLDRAQGRLYYYPEKTPPDRSQVIAPVVGRLFELLGDAKQQKFVSHVTIAGFTIHSTDYSPDDGCPGFGMGSEGVVYLLAARDCQIHGNRFRNIGKYAICTVNSQANRLADNDVAHGAEGGILLIDSAATLVSNNDIHHIGEIYKHVGGVILEGPGCTENVVSHNLVHDSSRYGISLKNPGRKNVIEYNELYDLNTETYDTGGIEVTQQNKEFRSGSVIRYNRVHDVGGYSSSGQRAVFMSWGIYLDSYAGGYEVSHNIVYRNSHGGLMIQGGKDNHVVNNIFVDGQRQQIQFNNFMNNSTGNRFQRNIVYYTNPDAVLFAAYRNTPQVVEADYNLYYLASDKPLAGKQDQDHLLVNWRKLGHDAHAVMADPCFVAPAKNDYTLRPESPAWKLGFQPMDAKQIGLRRSRSKE